MAGLNLSWDAEQGPPYTFVAFHGLEIENHTLKVLLRSSASIQLTRGFKGFQRSTTSLCSLKGCKVMGRQRLGKGTKIYGGPSISVKQL